MDIRVFDFPKLEPENYSIINNKVAELYARYRDLKPLDEIEIDWLDTANNWLMMVM